MPFHTSVDQLGLCRFIFKQDGWVDVLSSPFRGFHLSLFDPNAGEGGVFLGPPSNCLSANVGSIGVECTTQSSLPPRFQLNLTSLPSKGWYYAATVLLTDEEDGKNKTLPCSIALDDDQPAYVALFAMFAFFLAVLPAFLFLVYGYGRTAFLASRPRRRPLLFKPTFKSSHQRPSSRPNSIPSRSAARPIRRTVSLTETRPRGQSWTRRSSLLLESRNGR